MSVASPLPYVLVVLVADDDADMRRYVAGCLGRSAVVYEAADGHEALRLARAVGPDLVVSDVQVPGLDGTALRAALRDDPTTASIPVLLVGGQKRRASHGAGGVLAKPFNTASLRAAVEHVLATP